jgi:hypothetical protein
MSGKILTDSQKIQMAKQYLDEYQRQKEKLAAA